MKEAIRQLWRARTRAETASALDMLESSAGNWEDVNETVFVSIMTLIEIKGSRLTN